MGGRRAACANSLDEYCLYYLLLQCLARLRFSSKGESHERSTGTTSSASVYTTPAFWERLWRTVGIQSVLCFLGAYIVYGHQPQVGGIRPTHWQPFYDGDRMRILIRPCFNGLAVLNLMWFAGALRSHPGGCGQDGWGAAATRLQCPPSERFSSCSSRWSRPRVLDRQLVEITCSHRA